MNEPLRWTPGDVEITEARYTGWSHYPEAMIRGQAIHGIIEANSEQIFARYGEAMGLTPPGATLEEVAAALSRAAVPRAENWSWPPRAPGMAPSGDAEPIRAAFCHFLETGEPYHRDEEI